MTHDIMSACFTARAKPEYQQYELAVDRQHCRRQRRQFACFLQLLSASWWRHIQWVRSACLYSCRLASHDKWRSCRPADRCNFPPISVWHPAGLFSPQTQAHFHLFVCVVLSLASKSTQKNLKSTANLQVVKKSIKNRKSTINTQLLDMTRYCTFCCMTTLVAWRSGNAFHSINEVTVRRVGLVLRWVTACRQVNHFGNSPTHLLSSMLRSVLFSVDWKSITKCYVNATGCLGRRNRNGRYTVVVMKILKIIKTYGKFQFAFERGDSVCCTNCCRNTVLHDWPGHGESVSRMLVVASGIWHRFVTLALACSSASPTAPGSRSLLLGPTHIGGDGASQFKVVR